MSALRAVSVAFLTLGMILMIASPAMAYIDPGAGSMAVQAVMAAAMGVGLVLKTQWRRLRRRRSKSGVSDPHADGA